MFRLKLNGCLLYATPDCRPIISSACERFQSVIPKVSFGAVRTRYTVFTYLYHRILFRLADSSEKCIFSPFTTKVAFSFITLVMLRNV